MKRLLFLLMVSVALAMLPGLIPNDIAIKEVQVDPTAGQATPTTRVTTILGPTVQFAPGGTAQAWNLLLELCKMGWDDMCDLYNHGLSEGWWNG